MEQHVRSFAAIAAFCSFGFSAKTQINPNQVGGGNIHAIITAAPFLLITPDSRADGMGEGGVATSPDENSVYWNCAKLAFVPHATAVSISYVPWLRALVPDINLVNGSFYQRLKDGSTVGASAAYFSQGTITSFSPAGILAQYRPKEYYLDASYARKLQENFAVGMAVRYTHSDLTQGTFVNNATFWPTSSIAADIGAFYTNGTHQLANRPSCLRAGISITNFGSKMRYYSDTTRDFLPCDLRLGASEQIETDAHNSIQLQFECSKLLVPTPQVNQNSSNSNPLQGAIHSFYDAPGGFKEELREIMISSGVEYWYDRMFAVRAGYFHESQTKGDRQFVTLGCGVKYNVFGLDFAYLIPTNGQPSPLQNTLRFTLKFEFEKTGKPVPIMNADPLNG